MARSRAFKKVIKNFLKDLRKTPDLGAQELRKRLSQQDLDYTWHPNLYDQVVTGNIKEESDVLGDPEFQDFIRDTPQEVAVKKRKGEEYFTPAFHLTPQQREAQNKILDLLLPRLEQQIGQIGQPSPYEAQISEILKSLGQVHSPSIFSGVQGQRALSGMQSGLGSALSSLGSGAQQGFGALQSGAQGSLNALKGLLSNAPRAAQESISGIGNLLQGLQPDAFAFEKQSPFSDNTMQRLMEKYKRSM